MEHLRTVRPFVAAIRLCILCLVRDIRLSQGICPLIQRYFCTVSVYVVKADLSNETGIRIQKETWGNCAFSEIIELKFVKEIPYLFLF